MPITPEDARSIAQSEISQHLTGDDDPLLVVDKHTIERPWGWVFFYNFRRFVETGDYRYAAGGNAPLIVERESGRVLVAGTAHSTEFYLANYEATGDPHLRLGRRVNISSSGPSANRLAASKLLSRRCQISIGDTKRGVDAVVDGTPLEVDTESPPEARELCVTLEELGFYGRQLPEPAT